MNFCLLNSRTLVSLNRRHLRAHSVFSSWYIEVITLTPLTKVNVICVSKILLWCTFVCYGCWQTSLIQFNSESLSLRQKLLNFKRATWVIKYGLFGTMSLFTGKITALYCKCWGHPVGSIWGGKHLHFMQTFQKNQTKQEMLLHMSTIFPVHWEPNWNSKRCDSGCFLSTLLSSK